MDTTVETLLKKARETTNHVAAMNFAQAACNAANALRAEADAEGLRQSNKQKS